MRKKILVVLSIFVFFAINYSIYKNEQIKKEGEIIFFELTPNDPRSLMQGDYMRLAFTVEEEASKEKMISDMRHGYLVILAGDDNIAKYVRIYNGRKLAKNEKLVRFRKRYDRVNIVPNSFFFQENHGKYYANAKYGVFKFDKKGKYLLVNLADENKKIIQAMKE